MTLLLIINANIILSGYYF